MSRIFWIASSVLALCGMAWGQSEAGGATITGTVTDPTGAIVTAAKLTLNSEQTGFTRTVETNDAGLYSFVRIPVGNYSLTVDKSGFKSLKRTDLQLSVGALVTLDLQLSVGNSSESVTVSEEVPLVESTRSQTSTNIGEKAVHDLPINGRNFLDFTVLTPGVARDPRGGDLSFGGQRGTANSLLVDGMDSNNNFFGQSAGRAGSGRSPYSFSEEAVQEFQVNTNGFAAEFGRAGGGVINVITKSGANAFHGDAFEFFRDRTLNANTATNKSRGIARQPYHYNQFGGTIGGPIVKDKLFFFLSYDGQRNVNPNPVFFPFTISNPDANTAAALSQLQQYLTPYTTGLNNDIGLAKVDWNITDTQRLSVRYNIHRFEGQNFENSGAQSAQQHTGNSNVSTDQIVADYTKVIGSGMVYNARFNYFRDDEPGFANSDSPEVQIRQNNQTYMQFGRNNFSPRYTNLKTYQTTQAISYVRGRHTYKMGGDLSFDRIDNYFPGNFSGSFQFNSLADFALGRPAFFTQAFAGANTDGALTKPNVNEYAFYAQDAWRVTDRLTLNYGYRYDLFDYAQPKVANPDSGLAALGLQTNRINTDTNNHALRFGAAYRLDDQGKQVIRGGYGIFYGRTPAIAIGTAFSQNGIQVQTYTLAGSAIQAYPNVLSQPPATSRTPDIYVFAKDYVQPMTAQYNFSYETQLTKDIAVTVGYMGVRGYHLTRTRDINLYPSVARNAVFSNGTPAVYYTHPSGRPNANFRRISLFDSGGDSTYNAGFIQVNKRFSRSFQLLASYTWSKVIDTVPDATSVVVGSGDDAKVAQDTLLPNLDRAVGNANVPHNFIVSGVWDLNYFRGNNTFGKYLLNNWQISSIINARSGLPFSATVGGSTPDINGDGNARTDRPPFLGRNTYKYPNFYTVDLRVTKLLPLYKERVRLRLIGEAFNLANHVNVSGVNTAPYAYSLVANPFFGGTATPTFTPIANFGATTSVFDPRILQLAAKFEF